jgi:uncharacterized membrane protein
MANVIGLFDTREGAEVVIRRLRESGIPQDAISLVMKETPAVTAGTVPGTEGTAGTAPATEGETVVHTPIVEGTTVGAVSGAVLGTLVGLLVAGSTIILPGIGTFVIAGPIAAALAGAGIGAASGGILGALVALGIPEHEASYYASGVESGQVVVAVRIPEDEVDEVIQIFDEEGSRRTRRSEQESVA